MSNIFINAVLRELNMAFTENGALTNKSTLNPVLDWYVKAPTKRGGDVAPLLSAAYAVSPKLATLIGFYSRNPRGLGQGERDVFRKFLDWLYANDRTMFDKVYNLVPEYGRWDDLFKFIDYQPVRDFILSQFAQDISDAKNGRNVSLLAKYMPSENASSQETRELAYRFHAYLETDPKRYRKTLVFLRSKIGIVESLMSKGEWNKINYAAIPSKAHRQYRAAFLRHDEERYRAYLASVTKGEAKINAGVLAPYELLWNVRDKDDATIEAQWKALPNWLKSVERKIIPVVDMSGSMFGNAIPNTKVDAATAAMAIGIYAAQRLEGEFHNMLMTFDNESQFIKLEDHFTLRQAYQKVRSGHYGAGTNLISVFEKILETAKKHNIPQSDMPTDIMVLSDMQFNPAYLDGNYNYWGNRSNRVTNMDKIKDMYAKAGYELPRIIYWWVVSRVDEFAATKDEYNVNLIGGLNPSIMQTTFTGISVTPEELMLKTLEDEKFAKVRAAIGY